MPMDNYRKAKVIIAESSSYNSKANKLLKIHAVTEDEIFSALVKNMANAYQWYLPRGSQQIFRSKEEEDRAVRAGRPLVHSETVKLISLRQEELSAYIETVISMQKPEWQIVAERHGWRKVY